MSLSVGTIETAAGLVIERFNLWRGVATDGFNSAFSDISAIIDVAKDIAVQNYDVTVPVDVTEISDTAPYLSLMDFGKGGISEEAETALWEQGLEKAQRVLKDKLREARRKWATLGRPKPDGTLVMMLEAEIDAYEDERRASNLRVTGLSYDLAADFARTIIALQSAWSVGATNIRATQGIDEAQLRLRQANVALEQLVERFKLELVAIRGGANIANQLISAAFVGTSASASIHAGYSDSSSSSVGITLSRSVISDSSTSTRNTTSSSTNRQINVGQGTDITYSTEGTGITESTTETTQESDGVTTRTRNN